MSDAQFTIDIPELRGTIKALKEVDPNIEKYVARRLRPAAELIQNAIKDRTPVYQGDAYGTGKRARMGYQHLVRNKVVRTTKVRHTPGLLKRSTKVAIQQHGMQARIYNTARAAASARESRGYRYGKRLEFDPIYGGKYKFFYPAYEANKDKATAMLQQAIVDIANEFGDHA